MELEKLIKIEKKSSASQAMRTAFFSAMEKYLNENGFNGNAERYLFVGLAFCGMKPAYEWIIAGDENVRFKNISTCKTMEQNESGITFKAMLSLLNCYLLDKRESENVGKIIEMVGDNAKNKKGKYFNDINFFEKYFLTDLKEDIKLPELQASYPSIKNFIDVMTEMLSKVKVSKKITESKLNHLKSWLGIIPQSRHNQTDAMKAKMDVHMQLTGDVTRLRCENEHLLSKLKTMQFENSRLIATIESKEEINEELSETNLKLKRVTEELKITYELKIKELEGELQKRDTVLNIFEADKKNSQQGQLNYIAAKLRAEYEDFKSILTDEMTTALGENLRLQLINIFKILEKNGIVIEKDNN
jgi:hypothetical protein